MGVANARPLPRHPRVWWSRIVYRWPFVIWCAAIAACVFLYADTARTAAVSGVIDVQREEIAPVEAARLLKVLVKPGQTVEPGDVIAELDASVIEAEMNEIRAQFSLDQLDTVRQFQAVVIDAESRLRELELEQALDRNRLEALRAQSADLQLVTDAALESARGVALFKAEIDALVRNEQTYPAAIASARAQVESARARLEEARRAGTPEILAQLLSSLEQRRSHYVLRAGKAGTVSRLLHVPGDVVPEAEPVATIVIRDSQRITAFIPEWTAHDIAIGSTGWIARPGGAGDPVTVRVESLGPEIMPLPGRVSPIQGQTLRGRHAVMALDTSSAFLPGEGVNVHFRKPWWMTKYYELRNRFLKPAS